MKNVSVMIAGVGGQGTVLASKLIAAAAMTAGMDVRTTETIGMAQRGGSVVSHVRMGKDIRSPLVPLRGADLVLAFEPAEGVRLTPYLAPDGKLIACDTAVKPVTDSLTGGTYQAADMLAYLRDNAFGAVILSGDALVKQIGAKAVNVALLGAAVESGVLPFGADVFEKILETKIAERFRDMNLAAFRLGGAMYRAYAK